MTQPTESMIERLRTFIVQIETMTGDPIKYHPPLCDEAADLLEEAVKVLQIAIGEVYEAGDGRAIRLDSQWLEEATACAARIQGTRP